MEPLVGQNNLWETLIEIPEKYRQNGVLVEYNIYATDNAGNEKITGYSSLFTYDCLPPTTILSLGTPNYGDYVTSDTEITLSCNDAISGCGGTYYKIDEGSEVEYTVPFKITGESSHIIDYYSIDKAGNNEGTNTRTLILDNTAPEVVLTELEEFYNSVPIVLEFTYSETSSGVKEYKVYKKRLGADSNFVDITNNAVLKNCNTIDDTTTCEFWDGTSDQDGDFEFKVEVIDNVENLQESNVVDTVLDRWGPFAVELVSPENNLYFKEQPLLSWVEGQDNNAHLYIPGYGVSGVKEYELVLDGGTPIILNLSELGYQTLGLAEGAHTWEIRAWDNAGNDGEWSEVRTFTIDTTPPVISNVNVIPKYENYVAGTITASADVTDVNGIFSVTFELSEEECAATKVDDTWSCSIDTTLLEDGEYTLVVTTVDIAENGNVDDSLNIIVDNTAPITAIVSPAQSSLFASNFAVSVTDTDNSGSGLDYCEYKVNDGEWKKSRDCNADVTVTVGEEMDDDCNVEGENVCSIEVRARDNLENENTEVSRTFSIDWTNPPQILDSRPSGTIVNSFTELYVETNKPATCKYDTTYKSSYNAMTYTMGTTGNLVYSQYVPNLIDKSYNYYVICKDTAGNEMLYPASISFDVDTREEFNVTIPETKGDYLRTGWNQFFLPSFVLEDTNLTVPYLVRDVLKSIEGSYNIVYHYDGTIWRSYEPGRPVNDLIDLTEFNGGVFPYFIDMNVSGKRIEIN